MAAALFISVETLQLWRQQGRGPRYLRLVSHVRFASIGPPLNEPYAHQGPCGQRMQQQRGVLVATIAGA